MGRQLISLAIFFLNLKIIVCTGAFLFETIYSLNRSQNATCFPLLFQSALHVPVACETDEQRSGRARTYQNDGAIPLCDIACKSDRSKGSFSSTSFVS